MVVGVEGNGGTATLKLYDEAGKVVATRELGMLGGGRQEIPLADVTAGLPAGRYRYAVEVKDVQGNAVEVQTFVRAVIEGVRYGPGGPVLISGDLEIPLSDVVEVVAQG